MSRKSERNASLENMQAEIENLLSTLESLKGDATEESQKTLKALRSNAESALRHSRGVIGDAYEEVKTRTKETGIATRDYAKENPMVTAGVAVGVLGLLAAWLICRRD